MALKTIRITSEIVIRGKKLERRVYAINFFLFLTPRAAILFAIAGGRPVDAVSAAPAAVAAAVSAAFDTTFFSADFPLETRLRLYLSEVPGLTIGVLPCPDLEAIAAFAAFPASPFTADPPDELFLSPPADFPGMPLEDDPRRCGFFGLLPPYDPSAF